MIEININALDNLLIDNHGGSIGRLVEERSKCVENLWNKMELKEGMLRHKSRQLWLKEGDRKSRFFHNSLKDHYRRNFINLVDSDGVCLEEMKEVKSEVK